MCVCACMSKWERDSITDNVCPSLACYSAQPADKRLCEQEHPPLIPPWNSTWTFAPGCKETPGDKEPCEKMWCLRRNRKSTLICKNNNKTSCLSRRSKQTPHLSQSSGASCFLQPTSSELKHCYSSDTPADTHTYMTYKQQINKYAHGAEDPGWDTVGQKSI